MIDDDELGGQLICAAQEFPVRGWPGDLRRRVVRRRRTTAGLVLAAGVVAAAAVAVAVPAVAGSSHGPQIGRAATGHQSPAAAPSSTATAQPSPAGGCASQSHPAGVSGSGSPASSITVCPGSAPVGAVVRVTLQGCNVPPGPPAALVFLGPSSWIGSGGGGDSVRFYPAGGDRYTGTFTIPATYTGGQNGASPNSVLPVRPGDRYSFATYPVGVCDVPFTVTDGIQNLAISSGLRGELIAAYAAYMQIPPSDITGIEPGSAHYAYDPATDTYWALANFSPSLKAPQSVLINLQDGTTWGFFKKVGSGHWQAQDGGEPIVCLEVRFFPHAVLTAWSLPTDAAAFGC